MLEKETIKLKDVSAQVETIHRTKAQGSLEEDETTEDKFVVRVKVFNPETRTLYAYGTVRRYLYDQATQKLTLCLHDQHIEEDSPISPHLPRPKIVPLEGNTETEIKLSLPKIINRIKSAAERGGSGPLSEKLPISEAKEIKLEIAHQDTPFYYNPKVDNAKQLKEWGQQIAEANFNVKTKPNRKTK